jgi:hypothetical protein
MPQENKYPPASAELILHLESATNQSLLWYELAELYPYLTYEGFHSLVHRTNQHLHNLGESRKVWRQQQGKQSLGVVLATQSGESTLQPNKYTRNTVKKALEQKLWMDFLQKLAAGDLSPQKITEEISMVLHQFDTLYFPVISVAAILNIQEGFDKMKILQVPSEKMWITIQAMMHSKGYFDSVIVEKELEQLSLSGSIKISGQSETINSAYQEAIINHTYNKRSPGIFIEGLSPHTGYAIEGDYNHRANLIQSKTLEALGYDTDNIQHLMTRLQFENRKIQVMCLVKPFEEIFPNVQRFEINSKFNHCFIATNFSYANTTTIVQEITENEAKLINECFIEANSTHWDRPSDSQRKNFSRLTKRISARGINCIEGTNKASRSQLVFPVPEIK